MHMTSERGAATHLHPAPHYSPEAVVAVEGVTKTYSSGQALRGVSVSCRAGEVRALLGENGAGKSTLVKIISGAMLPDFGNVLLRGRPVNFRSPVDASGAG